MLAYDKDALEYWCGANWDSNCYISRRHRAAATCFCFPWTYCFWEWMHWRGLQWIFTRVLDSEGNCWCLLVWINMSSSSLFCMSTNRNRRKLDLLIKAWGPIFETLFVKSNLTCKWYISITRKVLATHPPHPMINTKEIQSVHVAYCYITTRPPNIIRGRPSRGYFPASGQSPRQAIRRADAHDQDCWDLCLLSAYLAKWWISRNYVD